MEILLEWWNYFSLVHTRSVSEFTVFRLSVHCCWTAAQTCHYLASASFWARDSFQVFIKHAGWAQSTRSWNLIQVHRCTRNPLRVDRWCPDRLIITCQIPVCQEGTSLTNKGIKVFNVRHTKNSQFQIRRTGVSLSPETKKWKKFSLMPGRKNKSTDRLESDEDELDDQLCKHNEHMKMKNPVMKFELNIPHT